MDKKVDEYIKKQKSPQKEICTELRKIITKTLPGIKEEFRMGVPWYGKYYIVALKDKVNLGFCIDGLSKEQQELFEGKGRFMRHIKIYSLKDIEDKRVVPLLKMVYGK